MISKFSLFLIIYFSSIGAFGQDENSEFIEIEKINDFYSIGFKEWDAEFLFYYEPYILSITDTLKVEHLNGWVLHNWYSSSSGEMASFEIYKIEDRIDSDGNCNASVEYGMLTMFLETAEILNWFTEESLQSDRFVSIEEINETYSVGYKVFDEKFRGYGDLWIISKSDTLHVEGISENICSLWNASPNGRYAFFETLSKGWLQVGDSTFLHDKWSGALVELETAGVVKYCRYDCGDEWNEFNFWMQNGQIIFNGNDTIPRSNETVYTEDESSDIAWISYHENGQVKETGQSGNILGCGMNIGTHYFYDENGFLIKTIRYENWLPDEADGCHSTIQETHISGYGKYQTLKSQKMYQSVYEGDEYKTGVWEEFDEHGNLISSHDYGMKYMRKSSALTQPK